MRRRVGGALWLAVSLALGAPASAMPSRQFHIDIPGGLTIGAALARLGQQTGGDFGLTDDTLSIARTTGVHGTLTIGEALATLFRGRAVRISELAPDLWRIDPVPKAHAAHRTRLRSASAPSAAPPDIVVIAAKLPTHLGDFPGSVAILNAGDLTFGGSPGGTDAIAAHASGLSSTHLGSGRDKLFLRGIADSSFSGANQATVGQYFGDARLTYNAPDPDIRLYDVGSVEVLEGPQGTLYGAGSLGGLIRIEPNAPQSDAVHASAAAGLAATQHGEPGSDLAAMLNLPLTPQLAIRTVGYAISDGGYIDDLTLHAHDINRVDTAGGRVALRWQPDSEWTVDLGVLGQAIDGADSQYASRGLPSLQRASAIGQGYNSRYALATATVRRDWGGYRFTSALGLVDQRIFERNDATQAEYATPFWFDERSHTRLLSWETRMSDGTEDEPGWMVGTSFLANRTVIDRGFRSSTVATPGDHLVERTQSMALFGQARVDLPWALRLTAGARIEHSRFEDDAVAGALPPGTIVIYQSNARDRRQETHVAPSIALSRKFGDDMLGYIRIDSGFRPGGIAPASGYISRFRSDHLLTIEAGIRYGGSNAPLHGSVAAARTDWRHIQADLVSEGGNPVTGNIGDGRIESLQIEGGWRPAPGVAVNAGLLLNHSRLYNPAITTVIVVESQLPDVAKAGGWLELDYRTPAHGGARFFATARTHYVGTSLLGVGPVLGREQGDYFETELSARYGTADRGVTLTLSNPFDTVGNRFAVGTPFLLDQPQVTPLRPRTLRLGIDSRF